MPFVFNTAGSGSAGVIGSGLTTASLALADAVLSNGAELAVQSGSLPERITTEPFYWLQPEKSVISSVIFGNDNRSVIISQGSPASVAKYDFTGSLFWQTSVGSLRSVSRVNQDILVAGISVANTSLTFITESNGQSSVRVKPSVTSRRVFQIPGSADGIYWIEPQGSNTGSIEFDLNTGLTTGRYTSPPGVISAVWEVSGTWDNIPSMYQLCTSGSDTWIVRLRESDLAEIGRWIAGTAYVAASGPGYSFGIEFIVDTSVGSSGSIFIRDGIGSIVEVPTAASASSDVGVMTAGLNGARRVIWPGYENWGPSVSPIGGGSQCSAPLAISTDRRYFAYLGPDIAGVNPSRSVFIRNIQKQTATWTWEMVVGTLNNIIIPGYLGASYGTDYSSGSLNAGDIHDYRKTRCYYQRATGDGSRVEFIPNEPINVALIAGQDLVVTVEFNEGLGIPGSPRPYIKSGLKILYSI